MMKPKPGMLDRILVLMMRFVLFGIGIGFLMDPLAGRWRFVAAAFSFALASVAPGLQE